MTALTRLPIAAAVGMGLAGLAHTAVAQSYTLNVNTALTQDDPLYKGLEMFEAAVEERTGGDLDIVIFPSSQLGKDEDVLEQARAGANVAVLVDGGRLAPFVKDFGIMGAPYLVDNFDQVLRLTASPLFKGWVEKLRTAANLQVLSFATTQARTRGARSTFHRFDNTNGQSGRRLGKNRRFTRTVGTRLNNDHHFIKWLFGDDRHAGILRRITHRNHHKSPFVGWTVEDVTQEFHGRWCVREGRQSG
jgi:hypothetical protein